MNKLLLCLLATLVIVCALASANVKVISVEGMKSNNTCPSSLQTCINTCDNNKDVEVCEENCIGAQIISTKNKLTCNQCLNCKPAKGYNHQEGMAGPCSYNNLCN